MVELADQRISIFKPVQNRGATANFKIAFESTSSDYVSVLEDDNWWEPDFLAEMIGALTSHGEADRAVANERIWRNRQKALGLIRSGQLCPLPTLT